MKEKCAKGLQCLFKNDKVLYEPIAPYFASSYMTVVSMVQSIALYQLLSKNFPSCFDDINIFLKSIIIVLVIALIWQRYVAHTQYLAWRLKIIDTIIPFGFGILQYSMIIYSKDSSNFKWFSLSFVSIFVLGFFAYKNAIRRFKESKGNKHVFMQHFCNIADIQSIYAFLERLIAYEHASLKLMSYGALVGFIGLIVFQFFHPEIISLVLYIGYCICVLLDPIPFLKVEGTTL